MIIQRREFLKFVGLQAAGLIAGGCRRRGSFMAAADEAGAGGDAPNFIFIMADDLGYAHLGCYGQDKIETANLDRMAAEGMKFTQFYAGNTVCAPSRCVLMTGYNMGRTSVRGNTGGIALPDEDVTVAEVLKSAGYATGMFGKWGLGDARTSGVPGGQGWDEFFGYLHQIHAHHYYPEYLWHNDEKYYLEGNADGKRGQYSHDLIMEKAKAFIRRNSARPFFCYLPVTLPHLELAVPEETLAEYEGAFAGTGNEEVKRKFAAMVTHLDKGVGEILELVRQLGIDKKTVVFFTSDNGGDGGRRCAADFFEPNGPLRGYKRDMYEGGLRVPLIVRWPGRVPAGSVSDWVGYFPDVMPTLAELAGAGRYVPKDIDGISMAATLTGQGRQGEHKFLYWEWPSYDWSTREYVEGGVRQAVRMGEYKAVRYREDRPWELYNLAEDIGEQNNIAGKHPEAVAKIDEYVRRTREPMGEQIEPVPPKGRQYR